MSKSGICQILCAVILVAFISISFFEKADTVKTADELADAVTGKVSTKGLEKFDKDRLEAQFGLNADHFGSFVYYGSEDIMDVREILVIKGKKGTDLKKTAELISKRAEDKYNTYKDYDALASALLENRVLETDRGAIIYIVDEKASAGLEAFLKCVEE